MQLLLLRACRPVRGVVSGNCICSPSATEHKTPTFMGRGLVVAPRVPAPRRDVTETPQLLCVPAAPGRALAEAPAVWLCCPRAVSHGLGLHILTRSQASLRTSTQVLDEERPNFHIPSRKTHRCFISQRRALLQAWLCGLKYLQEALPLPEQELLVWMDPEPCRTDRKPQRRALS